MLMQYMTTGDSSSWNALFSCGDRQQEGREEKGVGEECVEQKQGGRRELETRQDMKWKGKKD